MPEISATMPFTADFTSMQINNSHEWAGSTGGAGVKRRDEIESETKTRDDVYQVGNNDTGFSKAVTTGDFSGSHGNTILTNISRDSANTKANFLDPLSMSKSGTGDYSQNKLATTPAILPSDLTTFDRLNAGTQAYDVGSLSNPNTLGDTLTGLVEKVHDNAVSYETQADSLANKSKGNAFDQAKDSMISNHDSLSGGMRTKESEMSKQERDIENYIQVMNSSYEYYIYSSLFVDSGKAISQTAQTLTKG